MQNPNYVARVIQVKNLLTLEKLDNLVGIYYAGMQAIVSKDTKVGDYGIFIPTECQLSDEFCKENNLYRHADNNKDNTATGYLEDNRRIRAIKFRGNASNALFMPLSSLSYTGADLSSLIEGNEFDAINGHEILRKYMVPRNPVRGAQAQIKKESRVDSRHMPEHIDTLNFLKFADEIPPETRVVVTQKLHGTSIRIGHTYVKRKLSLGSKIARAVRIRVMESEHDYVYGSRKVIKDPNNTEQNHYYDTDIWTSEGKKLFGMLPKNYLVYGELIGHTPDGKEIQKDYAYNIAGSELCIYRIAIVNEDGITTDLGWEQVKEFCQKNNLKYVPELWSGPISSLNVNLFLNTRYFENGYPHAIYLGEKDLVDEGVVIRVEGITPRLFKAKASRFLEHETAMLDKGEIDLEEAQKGFEDDNEIGLETINE